MGKYYAIVDWVTNEFRVKGTKKWVLRMYKTPDGRGEYMVGQNRK